MTLEQILQSPGFEDFQIVAGENGKDREIYTVSVMDAPDIYQWMKGGEFLITSGYPLRECPDYAVFLIEKLSEKKVAALGIKFGRFIESLPEKALKTADKLAFPIVGIPFPIAFTDVINPVLRDVINSQSRKLMYTESLHKVFTQMAFADEEVPVIMSRLEEYICADAVFVDTCFGKVYISDSSGISLKEYKQIQELAAAADGQKKLAGTYVCHRLHINDEEYGYILIGKHRLGYDRALKEYYQIAVEQAGIVLILKSQKKSTVRQIETNYREQFVQDMLFGRIGLQEEIISHAAVFGWDFHMGGLVVLVDIDHFKRQYVPGIDAQKTHRMNETMRRILRICACILDKYHLRYVYSAMSDRIGLIFTGDKREQEIDRELLKHIFSEINASIQAQEAFTATIGISRYIGNISRISAGWSEANQTVKILRELGRENTVAFYEELGAYKLLVFLSQKEEALAFRNQYLDKLEQYDAARHTEFLHTLLALDACGWNLKATSEKLCIHYNSIKYRCRKISDILGVDLSDQEQRLNIILALRLWRISRQA